MKLKFLNPIHLFENKKDQLIFINPSYWFLKSYYKFKGKYFNNITWLEPIFKIETNYETFLAEILLEKPDIICCGLYVWNVDIQCRVLEDLKKFLPNIKIIIGGPAIDNSLGLKNFDVYKYADFIVYGDGEEAFASIINSIIEEKEIDHAVNLMIRTKKFPHKVFYDEDFSHISPYLELKDEVKRMVDKIGPKNTVLCYEISRGCPYSCSFCDWSSGLHNKVKRRKVDWKKEIDFFHLLGIEVLHVNDANWGLFDEDLEINRYALEKLKNVYAVQLPKTNKKIAFEMLEMNVKARKKDIEFRDYLGSDKISLQDIHPQILKNMDRPDVPWQEHKILIKDFVSKFPKLTLSAELMVGIPEQTIETWLDTIKEIEDAGFKKIIAHLWIIVANSPGNKDDYKKKWNINLEKMIWPNPEIQSIEHASMLLNEKIYENGYVILPTITNSHNQKLEHFLTMIALAVFYNNLKVKFFTNKNKTYKILKNITPILHNECKNIANFMIENKIFGYPFDGKIIKFDHYVSNDIFIKKIFKNGFV